MKEGQLVFVNYTKAEGDESQWEYGVVTEVFDDRYIAETRLHRTVIYSNKEKREENKETIERSGIHAEPLYKNGEILFAKRKGFLTKYYELPTGYRVYTA